MEEHQREKLATQHWLMLRPQVSLGEPPIMRGFSCRIDQGEALAIFGAGRSWKAAVVSAVLGARNLTAGRIAIGGISVSQMGQHQLRDSIAVVPRKTVIFPGTLKFNLGKPTKSSGPDMFHTDGALPDPAGVCPDGRIRHALQLVGLQLGSNLEDELAGASQPQLSPVEKQRLGLARAILSGADMVLLDNAVSLLDPAEVGWLMSRAFANKQVILLANTLFTPVGYRVAWAETRARPGASKLTICLIQSLGVSPASFPLLLKHGA